MKLNRAFGSGFSFGLASGVITTLGLMVGLYAGTGSTLAVIGGIITIAIADAFSDSMGMHFSAESDGKKSRAIWESMAATFLTKFSVAIIFLVPVLLLPLHDAIIAGIGIGAILLSVFSYRIAIRRKENPLGAVAEHIAIAAAVIAVTYFVGEWISIAFA
jgi:VIT1/CCC1 family predicted Fe2+/Mn2+ transporter